MKFNLYTDGSYSPSNPFITRGGCCLYLTTEGVVHAPILSACVTTKRPEYVRTRNFGGEILAVMQGLQFIVNTINATPGLDEENHVLEIGYDYKGVQLFIEPTSREKMWKPKNDIGKMYQLMYMKHRKNALRNFDIKFIKIKSHTGHKYNEYADYLASGRIPAELREYHKGTFNI